jgi:hypothetical protein
VGNRAAEGALLPPPTTTDGGTDFLLKLNKMNYDDAEACCNKFCGHLAAYVSQDEQFQVGSGQQRHASCTQ